MTSGAFSPHLNKGLGMGYIDIEYVAEGNDITIDTGKGFIAEISAINPDEIKNAPLLTPISRPDETKAARELKLVCTL